MNNTLHDHGFRASKKTIIVSFECSSEEISVFLCKKLFSILTHYKIKTFFNPIITSRPFSKNDTKEEGNNKKFCEMMMAHLKDIISVKKENGAQVILCPNYECYFMLNASYLNEKTKDFTEFTEKGGFVSTVLSTISCEELPDITVFCDAKKFLYDEELPDSIKESYYKEINHYKYDETFNEQRKYSLERNEEYRSLCERQSILRPILEANHDQFVTLLEILQFIERPIGIDSYLYANYSSNKEE